MSHNKRHDPDVTAQLRFLRTLMSIGIMSRRDSLYDSVLWLDGYLDATTSWWTVAPRDDRD